MLKLGFVTAILPNHTFEEVVSFATANSFACLEVMCWPKGKAERRYAGVTHIDVDNLNDDRVSEIKSVLKKKEVFISGLGYYPNPLAPDKEKTEKEIEHIKAVIKAARRLEISVVNTLLNGGPQS